MSIFKKIITTTLVGVMILLFGNCINIAAQNLNGTCGSGVSWTLDDDTGLLKISGNGSIDSRGWREYKALIKNVVIEEGITSISSWIFEKCGNMETITIPSSIVSIGEYAFENCQNIKEVYYGGTTEDWCKIQFENKYSNPMYYAKHFYNLYETNPLVLQKQQLIKEEKNLIKKEEAYLVYQNWFDNKIAELAQLKNDVEVAQSNFEDISIMMLEKEQEGAQVILSSTDTAIVDAYKALKNASINTEVKIADKEAEIANAEGTVFICKENYERSLTDYKDTFQYKGYSAALFDAKYNLNSALAVIKSYVSLGLGMEGITVNDVAMNDVQDKVYENWIISFGSEELTAAHNAYISALHQETGIDEAKIKLVEAFKPIKGDAFEKMYTDAINSYIFALETLDIANIAIHDYIEECLRRSTVVANELSRALENLSNLRAELGEPQTNYTEATGLYKELENAEEARKNYIAAYFENDVDYQQTLSDYTSAKNTLAAAKNALGSPSSYNASATGFYVEFEEVVTKVEKKITQEATKRINTVYQALVAEHEDVAAASNKLEEAKKILEALYASTETEILASTDELVVSNYKTLQDAIKQVENAILDKSAELERTKTTFEESEKEFKNLSSSYKETTQYKTYHNLLIDAKARHDSSLKNLKSMITLGLGNQGISTSDVEVTATQDLIYEYWNIVFPNSEIENAKNAFIASLDNEQIIDAKRNELINAFKVSTTDTFWIEYSFVVNEYVDSLITLTIANNDLHKYIDICLREVGAEVLQLQNLQAEVTRLETELGTPKTTTTQVTGLYKQLEEAETARIAYIQKYLAEDTNYSVVNNVLSEAHMGFVRAKISASSPILKYQEIKEINIPSTMTSIGDYQFIGFDNLEKVVISEGVVSIGAYAFYNCKKLEQITIPNSLSIIYNNAFDGCESLEKIYYVGTNTEFKDVIIYGSNSALIPSKIIDCPFHDLEMKNVNETNLKRYATCTTPDIYYYSCSKCNGTGTKTFEHGEALGHTGGVATCTKQATCSRCHQKYGSLSPHVYDKQIPDDQYLATKADCSHKATYYYSCECGKIGTEIFEHGVTLPHNFVDGKCIVCNRDVYIIGNLNDDDKVDSQDAIYLLMSTLFPSDYPTNQVCDFEKDGETNSKDAIYLLMYTLFPSDYPLE